MKKIEYLRLLRIVTVIGAVTIYMCKSSAYDFNCESDTVFVTDIVSANQKPGGDPGSVAGDIAERFIGKLRDNVIEKDSAGGVTLHTGRFDDITFLNTVTALARVSTSPGHKRINEIMSELENIGYRRGRENGFASGMIYFSDWAVDNKARNNVTECTERYSDNFRTKSLDKVTRNRSVYRALKDSSAFEAQKMVEMGFRTHKVPHLKREQAMSKEVLEDMRDGDIVVLLTPDPETDALEIGIVRKRDDGFHLIHPSSETGTVIEEKENLGRYIKRNAKRTYGWRWLRLAK